MKFAKAKPREGKEPRIDNVFAEQKDRMTLFIPTIGLPRAEATVTHADNIFNMKLWCLLNSQNVSA